MVIVVKFAPSDTSTFPFPLIINIFSPLVSNVNTISLNTCLGLTTTADMPQGYLILLK